MKLREAVLSGAVGVALLAVALAPLASGRGGLDRLLAKSDFGAFYCAAVVKRAGGDPYALAPLRTCEIERVYAPAGTGYGQHGIDPAPLPPYTLALLGPFTVLPYRIAGSLWLALIVVALFASAVCLRTLTGYPLWATLAVLSITGGTDAVAFGQTQPLITLGLAGAAALARARYDFGAAGTTALTLLEPHVGLAPCGAVVAWSRGRRSALGVLAALVLATSVAAGPGGIAEYFTRELPAHAFSETGVAFQYSLASFLWAFGASSAAAIRAGSLQYFGFVAAAIVLARPLSQRIGSPALMLFPAACAVAGGPFIHIQQIASALPFALYLASALPEFTLPLWISSALIAIPWGNELRLLLPLEIAIVAAATCAIAQGRSPKRHIVTAFALAVSAVALGYAIHRAPNAVLRPPEPASAVIASGLDPSLASTQYAIETRAEPTLNGSRISSLAARAPVWLGLAGILTCAVIAARRPSRLTPETAPTPPVS